MRGKGSPVCPFGSRSGITPAYAGKRGELRKRKESRRDHPRVCGEKSFPKNGNSVKTGSPPRMRGKVLASPMLAPLIGITPAYAGKRLCAITICCVIQDHPRVCGEKPTTRSTGPGRPGSPPRMRGKGTYQVRYLARAGITPAYAGKSRGQSRNCTNVKDHPRVCGEKTKKIP